MEKLLLRQGLYNRSFSFEHFINRSKATNNRNKEIENCNGLYNEFGMAERDDKIALSFLTYEKQKSKIRKMLLKAINSFIRRTRSEKTKEELMDLRVQLELAEVEIDFYHVIEKGLKSTEKFKK